VTKPRTKNGKDARFPFVFEKNGRTGRIKKWSGGKFGTYFVFAGQRKRNSFGSFEAAYEFLDNEFSKLDSDAANSLSLNPLNGDVRNYSELEQLLRREGDGATLRDAVSFYLANRKTKKFEPKKFTECVDLFLKSQEGKNVAKISLKTFKKHLRRFQRDFGGRNIHDITTLEISTWLSACKNEKSGEPWSVSTQSNVRGSLVTLSIFAQKTLKAIPDLGDTEFQNVSKPNEDEKAEVEIFTSAQLEKLFTAAIENDVEMIPALVVGNFLGLRPFEFHAEGLKRSPLKWETFNWHDNHLHFKGQKVRSKGTREIPLQAAAIAWLEPFKGETGAIWKHTKAFDYRMQKLRGKAGVEGIRDGFRHSYASYRVKQLKGNLAQLAAEMGNSPEEITDSYKRGVSEAQAVAWFGVMPPKDYAKKIAAFLASRKTA